MFLPFLLTIVMKRKPKFQGSGIFMMQQTYKNLIKGDYVWDADWGYLKWNGKKWEQVRKV